MTEFIRNGAGGLLLACFALNCFVAQASGAYLKGGVICFAKGEIENNEQSNPLIVQSSPVLKAMPLPSFSPMKCANPKDIMFTQNGAPELSSRDVNTVNILYASVSGD